MPAPQKPTKPANRNNRRDQAGKTPLIRVNDRIRAPRVRVVTAKGDQLGVMATRDALAKAKEIGLDLVEVAPNADPPVCRLIDYGKYKYMQAKLQKNNKTKAVKMKEVKLRVGTDVNDYNVKMSRTEQFLDHGHKVRFQLRFRNRENAHRELGEDVINRVLEELREECFVEQAPKTLGRILGALIGPPRKNGPKPARAPEDAAAGGIRISVN